MKARLLTLIAAAALLAACQSEETTVPAAEPANEDVTRVGVCVEDFVWGTTSRTTAGLDGQSLNFRWADGDVLGVYPDQGAQVDFHLAEGAGEFHGRFDGVAWALKKGRTYTAYYPYSYDNSDRTAIPLTYEGQEQDGNNSVAKLTKRDYLASAPLIPDDNGEVTFHMQHLGCAVCLVLTVPTPATYTKFTLSAPTAVIPIEQTLNLATGELTGVTLAKDIELTLSNITTTAANETVTLYLLMPACDLTGIDLTATLADDTYDYVATLVGNNFVKGSAVCYTTGLTMAFAPEWVDMGLSVKWAAYNVGATAIGEAGDRFAWGEVTPKEEYLETNSIAYGKSFAELIDAGIIQPSTYYLTPEHDAATYNWGSRWRMPTEEEITELKNHTTVQWKNNYEGVPGLLVTSKVNGNTLFFPQTMDFSNITSTKSYYWARSPRKTNIGTPGGQGLSVGKSSFGMNWASEFYSGFWIRPVRE